MKIAHILPHGAVFPLKKHNGRYEWALRLARLQVQQGHDVTVFSGTRDCPDYLGIHWQTVDKQANKLSTNKALFTLAFSQDFAIYHSHFDSLGAEMANATQKPVITTQHWFPTEKMATANTLNTHQNHYFVPVTHYMGTANAALGLHTTKCIYHGIDLSLFSPSNEHGGRFICAGRITEGKGTKQAVELAVRTGVPLDIIGKINSEDQPYWDSFSHLVDGNTIRYLGQLPQRQLAQYFAHAKALLFPSVHIEAFGQTTIEAQASGCPVIISDTGASAELVIHGVTGFVAKSDADYIEAIRAIHTLDRAACRKHAELFDVNQMVANYTRLYESLANS